MPTRKGLAIFVAGAIAIVAVSVADRLTREDLRFGFLYLVPIGATAWWAGRTLALVAAGLCALLLIANDLALGLQESWLTFAFNEFTRVTTFFALGFVLAGLRRSGERLREESERSFRLAVTDELTGLYNRHFLREQLGLANSLAPRHGRPYSAALPRHRRSEGSERSVRSRRRRRGARRLRERATASGSCRGHRRAARRR